jgi:hypothetical protein
MIWGSLQNNKFSKINKIDTIVSAPALFYRWWLRYMFRLLPGSSSGVNEYLMSVSELRHLFNMKLTQNIHVRLRMTQVRVEICSEDINEK